MEFKVNYVCPGLLSSLLLLTCLIAVPALADEPCDDVPAVAHFVSTLPKISTTQLHAGGFTVAEKGQYTGRFTVVFLTAEESLFERSIYDRDSGGGGLARIVPAKVNGVPVLGFLYQYGAAGRIGCLIVITPSVQKNGDVTWKASEPDYETSDRDKWYTLKKGEVPPMPTISQKTNSGRQNAEPGGRISSPLQGNQSPQGAVNTFVNAHFSKCGDSSYLMEYAGLNMFVGIRELKGLMTTITLQPVSEVDKLNGLEGKGTLRLSATANRFHSRDGEWSEWKQGFATFHSDLVGGPVGQEIATQVLPMISKKGVWQIQAPLEIEQSKSTTCTYFAQIR
ncbi:MAG TPA: hypothetical protein VG759_01025 [Candidatus Angelobacter sp.]|nr:hypothetical protein [Candidatus Angelobacter sp.]